ncbi:hypothetical protein BDW42DRAFT_90802 [Aspergillus taichungensis]|uniref:Uncharacterized protein n=1 Tax=Aspergillus taichungensis TaxID=482145 RepID=A0A2J5HW76_9EURO|nr:hypothetical protein BDW42DRAFT_90802 [Aspergillus taichungensis]
MEHPPPRGKKLRVSGCMEQGFETGCAVRSNWLVMNVVCDHRAISCRTEIIMTILVGCSDHPLTFLFFLLFSFSRPFGVFSFLFLSFFFPFDRLVDCPPCSQCSSQGLYAGAADRMEMQLTSSSRGEPSTRSRGVHAAWL